MTNAMSQHLPQRARTGNRHGREPTQAIHLGSHGYQSATATAGCAEHHSGPARTAAPIGRNSRQIGGLARSTVVGSGHDP
jgi:hypothetical protein